MADKLIITPNETKIEEVETIVVIRSPEEFADAVMKADPEFGRIHKNPHNDPWPQLRKRK